jgi:acetyl-CoA acetyltransferase
MYEYGTTPEQMAKLAVDQRFNALKNPNSAFQGTPITIDDVLNSRYVNEPLHLLECVMPSAGAAAVIMTRADRAKSGPNKPVYILGAGLEQANAQIWETEKITTTPARVSAMRAYQMSGYGPRDIQFAEFYDCYTILIAMTIEDAGLAPKGEVGPFYESTDTTYKGTFPINTDGGQISSGQPGLAGGFRHVVEGARQIMGRAGERQVVKNDLCLVNG